MELEIFKNKGLSGLANLGNTCFINSCVQVLSHTYELSLLLNQPSLKKKIKNKFESALLVEYDNLRTLMWNENCVVSPGRFVKTIQKIAEIKDIELFTGFKQNDVPEFLMFVIDCFHTALSREVTMKIYGTTENDTDNIATKCFEMIKNMYSKEYSEIWNLFYAVHVSELLALDTGERVCLTPEPFFMINLPIPTNNKNVTLLDCFQLYVAGEILSGDNAWFYDKIDNVIDVRKKISFWSLPTILVIDFKRFNARNQKNHTLITFPLKNLDLSPFVIGYKKTSYVYDLYAVCNHGGGAGGGHYSSYVKNANGNWYHFNDTLVTEIDPASVVSAKAYCLFYRIIKKNDV